jgi:hypothetical protein
MSANKTVWVEKRGKEHTVRDYVEIGVCMRKNWTK